MSDECEHWRDFAAEQAMKDLGVSSWDIRDVPMGRVNWEEGWQNHARLKQPKDVALIESYGLAMDKGDVFPAIVLFERTDDRFDVAGGNHRGAAADLCGKKTIKAYIVKADDAYVLDQLPRLLNIRHGKATPPDEIMSQAVLCVLQHGRQAKEVAANYHLNAGSLKRKVLIARMDKRLDELGIKAERFSESHREAMATLDNDNVLREAIKLLCDTGMTSSLFWDLSKRTRDHRTEASQINFLEQERKALLAPSSKDKATQENNGAPDNLPPKQFQSKHQKFTTWISTGERLTKEGDTLEKHQVTKHDEQEIVCKRLLALAATLTRMAKECQRSNDARPGRRKASQRR